MNMNIMNTLMVGKESQSMAFVFFDDGNYPIWNRGIWVRIPVKANDFCSVDFSPNFCISGDSVKLSPWLVPVKLNFLENTIWKEISIDSIWKFINSVIR